MANREELGIIKGARTGDRQSQLALGKLYLFGSAGLPKSAPTALHWLQRAARAGCDEACLLIGAHIPYDIAQQGGAEVVASYARASDAGVVAAGLVLAQLTLGRDDAGGALRAQALRGLKAAAQAGLADAQWLLAQHSGAGAAAPAQLREGQAWLAKAADNGVSEALYAVLGQAWEDGDAGQFLARALPVAQLLLQEAGEGADGARKPGAAPLSPQEVLLLSRCAELLQRGAGGIVVDAAQRQRFCELAAEGGDRAAQLSLGLWFARMDAQGSRVESSAGAVNFKRAIRWLTQAGEQGLADAWFALSRIYIKPEFSQRSVSEAQSYLERAADMGHGAAQLECGIHAWRTRRDGANNDVRAAYWLMKAAAQGSAEAEAALGKIAPSAVAAPWSAALGPLTALELAASQPLLAARLELAGLFGLSRAEALLVDVNAADQGHCLVIDIRASYGRSKRRLVLVRTAQQRQALERIGRVFERLDCGLAGPEGNYRQRLYRLKTYLPESLAEPDGGLLPA
ncbi:tetratricopeptide repeat protein [Janthinobacterium fluminis]|uniref:Sel1 repeat family protein n=1 Tax=Janthinobacterium fluminis TaxID=2987524 RepID=A0ABT5K609_9BURK|nr:hypothetical protein [Janthinobacterium fluminis]MDC8760441.1 hypothetical protein [Janthinobacterium fluminis]